MITPERRVSRRGKVTYAVRFRYRDKQTSETFDRADDAKRFAKVLDALGPQGALDQLYADGQAPEIPRLDQVAAAHIEHLVGVEIGTRLSYTRLWNRTWAPLIGHIPVNEISKDDLARAVNALSERYATKSLENQRGLLVGVLQRAVDQELLTSNPAKKLRLPRGKEAEAVEMRIIDPGELAGVLPTVDEHHRAFVMFLYGTGARFGEAIALQVQDWQRPNIRIRRAVKWSPDGSKVTGATKTKRSNRTVVVPTELHRVLDDRCSGRGRTELIFTAPRGGSILHRTFWSRVWLPAVQHLKPRPRIHDLRHSHASVLLAAGVPLHVVQRRLGHESIQTTVDRYTHLLPDAQVAAAAAADAAFLGRAQTSLEAARAAIASLPAGDVEQLLDDLLEARAIAAGDVVRGELGASEQR